MQNKKLIALIALSIVAFFSLIYGVTSSSKTKYKSPSETKISISGIQAVEKTVSPRQAKRSSYTSWGRTPFSLKPIKSSQGPIVEGILWDKDNPRAIIDGSIVKIGEIIDKNTVVDIKQDRVILNDGTKDFELKLGH